MEHTPYLPQVREQYENFPYPLRNPDDEKKRLYPTTIECLDCINYYCFSGKRDFTKDFRALSAGGGTGDATIFLAEQLRDTNAEIVYIDISAASMEIAKQRAAVRHLNNIKWIQASLLDIPSLDLGVFDYINCSGVLHHLADPDAGLAILSNALKDNGAIGIMVYAQYGRTAVYQIQELMRIMTRGEPDKHKKLAICRSVLKQLPSTNWLRISAHYNPIMKAPTISDDFEIYDLFLHSQDRAYTIHQLYDFVEKAGLQTIQLFPQNDPEGMRLYDPSSYLKDSGTLDVIRHLDARSQQAVAELLHGMIAKHVFYAAKSIPTFPKLENLDYIPFLDILSNRESYLSLYEVVCKSTERVSIFNEQTQKRLSFVKTPHAEAIFKYLDGKRSTKEIFDAILASASAQKTRPSYPRLLEEFKLIFDALSVHNWLFLRDPKVHPFTSIPDMQKRVAQLYMD